MLQFHPSFKSSELTELCLGYSAIFTPFFDTYNEI